MALLPQDPKQQKALIAIVLAAGISWAFWSYWATPRTETIVEQEARLEALENQNRRAQVIATRGGAELEQRLALYERHIEKLEELIPREEQVAALLNSITLQARVLGVDLQLVRPEPEEPGQFYTRSSYEMRVRGEYHDVARFLTQIASLPRIVTPIDLQIETGTLTQEQRDQDPEAAPVTARFRIQTYVLPDRPPASQQPQEGA